MTAQTEIQHIPDRQSEYYGPCRGVCLCLPRPKGREWWQAGTAEPLVAPADVWRPS